VFKITTYADGGSTQTLWEKRTPWKDKISESLFYQSRKPEMNESESQTIKR